MPLRCISQLAWGRCRRCGRVTRWGRERAIRPAAPMGLLDWIRIKLFDWLNGWRCLEHPALSPSHSMPRFRGWITSIEGFPHGSESESPLGPGTTR
jgi:hypothetical protein